MALVTSLELSTKGRQSVHRPTRCLYAIVAASGGERYLQLDTVGSDDREFPEKVSQTIQFDRQAAGQLIQVLRQTFPDLAGTELSAETGDEESEEDDVGAIEGRKVLRLHRLKERDPRLVRRKKHAALSASGQLLCEVCGFDFAVVYGPVGEGFAECHHRVPLAALDGAAPTRLGDLAIVCANCHRMLHRRPGFTVEQLRELVTGRQGAAIKVLGGPESRTS